jgi:uncharacterized protein YjbJ (UPF0337 family)
MDWDQLHQTWPRMRGSLRHRWGRLTEDDLDMIDGHRETFIELVEERYDVDRPEALQRIEEWLRTLQEQRVLTGKT